MVLLSNLYNCHSISEKYTTHKLLASNSPPESWKQHIRESKQLSKEKVYRNEKRTNDFEWRYARLVYTQTKITLYKVVRQDCGFLLVWIFVWVMMWDDGWWQKSKHDKLLVAFVVKRVASFGWSCKYSTVYVFLTIVNLTASTLQQELCVTVQRFLGSIKDMIRFQPT